MLGSEKVIDKYNLFFKETIRHEVFMVVGGCFCTLCGVKRLEKRTFSFLPGVKSFAKAQN
jgi:hypothetical protein